jgi:hypothetical protein
VVLIVLLAQCLSNEYWHYLMQEAWVIASLTWIIDWNDDP